MTILPLWLAAVFAFCIGITVRARRQQSIDGAQARSVYLLLFAFFVWTSTAIGMGVQGIHTSESLLEKVPLLWQACVPVAVLGAAFLSRTLRAALRGLAASTPSSWLVFVQALRIGALGGVMKGFDGEITSSFVYWVGIPDFLFGASAVVVGSLLLRRVIGRRFLMIWSLAGAAIILVPTFVFMSYWMNEPGFTFIFEFPMVLAPGIVVPMLIFLNFLLAWGVTDTGGPQRSAVNRALISLLQVEPNKAGASRRYSQGDRITDQDIQLAVPVDIVNPDPR